MKRLLKYLGYTVSSFCLLGMIFAAAFAFGIHHSDFANHTLTTNISDAAEVEMPIYIVLKEPILVDIQDDTVMVYKIRANTTDITDHGMVNIIPYHKEVRQELGNHLRIPIANIRCIVTGNNKIKGCMWD